MADIFLSYSREDHGRAEQIAKALTAAGYEVFWDVEIPPGKSWADILEEKLAVCKAAIVLWSKVSTSSKWVREEARLAHDRGKLIPVQIDDAPPPFGFGEIQAADLKQWRGDPADPHWRIFLNAVSAAVARPPAPVLQEQTTPIRMPTLKDAAAPIVTTMSTWLAPAMRGYLLAGVGVIALLGAVVLRYMPSPAPRSGDTVSTATQGDTPPAPQPPPHTSGSGSTSTTPGSGSSGTVSTAPSTAPPPTPPPPAPIASDGTMSSGVTRQGIVNYLNGHGYSAKLDTDSNNNKTVATSVDGIFFSIYFVDCQGERCPSVLLAASWQMTTAPTAQKVNEWNQTMRMARAFINEKGDLFMQMDINFASATSTDGEIGEYLSMWKKQLANFKKHFSL